MTALIAGFLSISFFVLIIGVAYKIRQYWNTPAPLKIATTPAPVTPTGVFFRMLRELFLFESLFKSNKWIWLFGYIFHIAMALVLIRHIRYFTDPVWDWVRLMQPFGKYAGFLMALGLIALWARRFLVDRVRYISSPSDHLMLALLVGIAISGLAMKYINHTDIIQLKIFTLGLIYFNWQPLPLHPVLIIHLVLVAILMLVFPFSKLLHAPGVLFSPTRNQLDNPREYRHLAAWASKLETHD